MKENAWPKRLAALILALVLVTGFLPLPTLASDQEIYEDVFTHINPEYADIISEENLPPFNGHYPQTFAEPTYVTSVEEAAVILREQLEARALPAVVYYTLYASYDEETVKALGRKIRDQAFSHTGEPTEGDYLLKQYGGGKTYANTRSSSGVCNITFTYDLSFYTT